MEKVVVIRYIDCPIAQNKLDELNNLLANGWCVKHITSNETEGAISSVFVLKFEGMH